MEMTGRGMRRKLASGIARYGVFRAIRGVARLLRFRVLKPETGTILTARDGIVLNFKYPDQFMPTLAVFKDLVEPEYEYLRRILRKQSVFFDVGGGIGAYSIVAAKIVDGPIHTFEPVNENIHTIRLNMKANGVLAKIRLNTLALSNQKGFTQIERGRNLLEGSITNVSNEPLTGSVNVTTIDAYCSENRITYIDVIKIDAQGHEQEILEGAVIMRSTKSIGIMILETDHRLASFYRSLKDDGFDVYYYDYRFNALNRISPMSEETIKNSAPSEFSSNIILIHQQVLQRHMERFAFR
jgi:FkbM family methyltransferase